MKYLLDTHVLLWFLMKKEALSDQAQAIILNPKNEIFASTVSFWEISLKYALGKLSLVGLEPEDLENLLFDAGIGIIGLNERESSSVHCLPKKENHKDPFDRMLIWQAMIRSMALISKDEDIAQYRENGLRVIW